MRVPIAEAGEQLDELVDLAAKGEEIILTRDGEPVVLLEPVRPVTSDDGARG